MISKLCLDCSLKDVYWCFQELAIRKTIVNMVRRFLPVVKVNVVEVKLTTLSFCGVSYYHAAFAGL